MSGVGRHLFLCNDGLIRANLPAAFRKGGRKMVVTLCVLLVLDNSWCRMLYAVSSCAPDICM